MRNLRLYSLAAAFLAVGLVVTLTFGDPAAPTLRGMVLDASGHPVAGARVELRLPGGGCAWNRDTHVPARVTTGEDGAFRLPAPLGEMEVYASHPGHAPGWVRAADGAVIRLKAAAFLEITVDAPAEVVVAQSRWRFHRTNAEGTFRSGPLPPEVVLTVTAEAKDRRPFRELVELAPGETRSLDIRLPRGLAIRGSVQPPLEGVSIRASQGGLDESFATTGADGTFELGGLEDGPARIVAIAPGRPVLVVDAEVGETVELRWDR